MKKFPAILFLDNTSADNLALALAATRPGSLLDVKAVFVTGRAAHRDPKASIDERQEMHSSQIHLLNTKRMSGFLRGAGRSAEKVPVYMGELIFRTNLRTVIPHAVHADEKGRLHAFESLEPAKTALVVIDLDLTTGRDSEEQVATMAHTINALSSALRKHGGTVAWVTTPIRKAAENFRLVFGDELTDRYEADGASGRSATLWPELAAKETDIHAAKQGHSAFFPGKSDLHERLQARGITTILIAGAVTNVCCEASARDAAELHYKVMMVSDALIGHSYGLHEASLATFFRCYGDVRPGGQLLGLLGEVELSLRQ